MNGNGGRSQPDNTDALRKKGLEYELFILCGKPIHLFISFMVLDPRPPLATLVCDSQQTK